MYLSRLDIGFRELSREKDSYIGSTFVPWLEVTVEVTIELFRCEVDCCTALLT
jgi:hypothetical protein